MARDEAAERFATTLRALAVPRRAVPIAAVTAALVAVQLYYAASAKAALVPLAMVASFVVLAPWSWRRWLGSRAAERPRGRAPRQGSWPGRAAYAALAVAAVALSGVALPRALGLGPTYFTDAGSLGISVVLFAVGGWGLGRDLELEHGLEEARLLALHTHLDPHFLYNTLNAIAEWCAEDAKVAEEAIARLAGMMRELLAGLELARWPLRREVALAADLLELHRLRDAEALTVRVTLDEEAAAVEVPPLLVLALVENAVKHGPRSGHRGQIELEVKRRGGEVVCRVENPGPYAPSGEGGGHGSRTLRRRLQHAYGGRARLNIGQASAQAGVPNIAEAGALDQPRTQATLALPLPGGGA